MPQWTRNLSTSSCVAASAVHDPGVPGGARGHSHQRVGVILPEFPRRLPDRLVGDRDTTGQHELGDIPELDREPGVELDAVADDLAQIPQPRVRRRTAHDRRTSQLPTPAKPTVPTGDCATVTAPTLPAAPPTVSPSARSSAASSVTLPARPTTLSAQTSTTSPSMRVDNLQERLGPDSPQERTGTGCIRESVPKPLPMGVIIVGWRDKSYGSKSMRMVMGLVADPLKIRQSIQPERPLRRASSARLAQASSRGRGVAVPMCHRLPTLTRT
jgi:hypothetical protein